MVEEIKPISKEKVEKSQLGVKLIKGFAVLLCILFIIILVIIKVNNPEFKLGWLILWIVVIVLLTVLAFLVIYLINKFKNKKELDLSKTLIPPAITIEQAREIAKRATRNEDYAEYVDKPLGERTIKVGYNKKEWVYIRKCLGEYCNDIFYIFVNMHYPDKKNIFIVKNDVFGEEWWAHSKIIAVANELCDDPTPQASTRETYIRNPITMTEERIRETIRNEMSEKKESNVDKEKKEGLL